MKFFRVNPLDFFRGYIKFPIGFYTYDKCNCKTCKGANAGWGIMFLLFGVRFTKGRMR